MKKSNTPVEYNEKDYEFMNSLSSAILEQSPSKIGKVLKIWMFTVLAFIIWASLAQIDEITRGDGKVIPYGQNQIIQNLEGGIVEAILVEEGKSVKKGDVILKINNAKSTSTSQTNVMKYNELLAKQLRLNAEANGLEFEAMYTEDEEFNKQIELAKKLYSSNPDIVKALPVLLAVRENKLEIFDKLTKNSEFFDFSGKEKSPEKYYEFLEKSGLARLFQKDGVKNLVDYVMGVEVGLDSNGRKNRGGSLMEEIVESFIRDLCNKNGFEYLSQARATAMKNKWGVDVRVDKSERSFDFAVFNTKNKKVKLFEVNFYNGGGSKLKAVCGEFRSLHTELKEQNIDFIWITDGLGWFTTKRPLEETYNHNDYVFNLNMLEAGILDKLIW